MIELNKEAKKPDPGWIALKTVEEYRKALEEGAAIGMWFDEENHPGSFEWCNPLIQWKDDFLAKQLVKYKYVKHPVFKAPIIVGAIYTLAGNKQKKFKALTFVSKKTMDEFFNKNNALVTWQQSGPPTYRIVEDEVSITI